ncbi:MAG: hypothetical protein IH986_06650 [Planctomycetes bacterium]|nr:hypothetical protein [Planctomycetota bacterium]
MLRTKKILVPALLMGSALAWTVNWQSSANAQIADGIGQSLAVVIQGTATGELRMIDGVEMNCFDVDLVDAASGRIIGRGTDCLDLNSIVPDPSGGAGFSISNTQFFHLPGGTIKSRHRTTIQPVLEGSPGITHITGAIPAAPNILGGTGRYRDAEGTVRLTGAVDLSRLAGENIITFDCVFRIDLSDK